MRKAFVISMILSLGMLAMCAIIPGCSLDNLNSTRGAFGLPATQPAPAAVTAPGQAPAAPSASNLDSTPSVGAKPMATPQQIIGTAQEVVNSPPVRAVGSAFPYGDQILSIVSGAIGLLGLIYGMKKKADQYATQAALLEVHADTAASKQPEQPWSSLTQAVLAKAGVS